MGWVLNLTGQATSVIEYRSHSKTCSYSDDSKVSFGAMEAIFTKDFGVTRSGPLQRQLRKGEYGFFKYSPMLESDFVQITKQGGPIEVTNEDTRMTVGISFTSPALLMPDVLLVARPIYISEDPTQPDDTKYHPDRQVKYELSRLFPLCLVKLSILDAEKQQLRVKLANGRIFYLQLCPESYRKEHVFDSWIRTIRLLLSPSDKMSEIKEEAAIKSSQIQRSPPKTLSPKSPTKRATAGSEQTTTTNLRGGKRKKKPSKAKSPESPGKAPDPTLPPKAEQGAELVSPVPPQTKEMTEVSEEKLGERKPSGRNPTGKKGRQQRSYPTSRCYLATQQASFSHEILGLGNPRKNKQGPKRILVQREEIVSKGKIYKEE
uniref:Uncharacterized protein n=1 Tax=Sphaerodactylus townsendi TaxID=933632 RepID=A0ACB8EUE0_9SAUR